ncbi:MAG: ABC transporter ATP-binding protein [Victivallales bacterium]|nr:ABC transporter ATP-binding protein [Victivallales bacterium]
MELELQRIQAGYGSHVVLDGLSLRIAHGKITALLGPNGCGKSTLLKVMARSLKPFSGRVLLDGRDIADTAPADLARVMALLPQVHQAPDEVTVQELVELGRFPHRSWKPFLSRQDRAVVEHVLELTQLRELRMRPVQSLSGGERQRAWIALTLAQEPKLLLLDEPTTFLDISHQFEVLELIRSLNQSQGITVALVLHDLNLAAACADTLVLLKDRNVHCTGTPSEVLTEENLRDVFHIQAHILRQPDGIPHCIVEGVAKSGMEAST